MSEPPAADARARANAEPLRPLLATRDFDEAFAAFLSDAVHAAMAEADPVYAGMRRVPLPEGVTQVRVQAGGSDTDSPEVAMTETAEIRLDDVLAGELESLHGAVAAIAETHLRQFMLPFYEHVGDAAEAVGNNMSFGEGEFDVDAMLDAYERVEWAADATGTVRPPQVAAGRLAAERINALPPPTPEQARRWIDMQARKQEEHVSRRRRRRLR